MNKRVASTLVFCCVAGLAATGQGQVFNWSVQLDGSQENPPVATSATGLANVSLTLDTSQLEWNISHTIDMGDVTAAHFHRGAVGVNGPVTIPLDHTQNPMIGLATLNSEQISEVLGGLWYVNVHTSENPGGEIRGQLHAIPEPASVVLVALASLGLMLGRRRH